MSESETKSEGCGCRCSSDCCEELTGLIRQFASLIEKNCKK